MGTARDADHAMGLELRIEELVEQRARATAQGREADGARLDEEIAALQAELAAAVEAGTGGGRAVIRATPAAGDRSPGA